MAGGLHLGPVGGRIVTETLIGLLRADPTSYLSVHPRFEPFLGTDLKLGPTANPNITGNRAYTRAHFLHYADVVTPGGLPMITQLLTPSHVAIRLETVPRSRGTSPARSEGPRERGQLPAAGDRHDRVRRPRLGLWLLVGRPVSRSSRARGRAEWVWSFHPRGHCQRWRVRRSSSGRNRR